jgi:hypothetical protein
VLLVFSQKSDLRHLDFMVLLRGGLLFFSSQRSHSLSSSAHKRELFSHKNLKLTDASSPKRRMHSLTAMWKSLSNRSLFFQGREKERGQTETFLSFSVKSQSRRHINIKVEE